MTQFRGRRGILDPENVTISSLEPSLSKTAFVGDIEVYSATVRKSTNKEKAK